MLYCKEMTDQEANLNIFEKCPCCNKNPWSAATGDIFAKICSECQEEEKSKEPKEENDFTRVIHVDTSIAPHENFYLYANNQWMKRNPIPSGYPSWNTFMQLSLRAQELLKELLEDGQLLGQSPHGNKCSSFYSAAMDEDKIERDGIEYMLPLLHLCDEAYSATLLKSTDSTTDELIQSSKKRFASCSGRMLAEYGVSSFFSIGASPDYTNSDHSICQLFQGGLGMPDRDYYFDEAKEEKRTAYKAHIAKMLYLLHQATDNNQAWTDMDEIPHQVIQDANAVYDLEKSLAEAHMTKTENRDPHATYNKMELLHLMSTVCQDKFDFKTFFSTTTGFQEPENELGEINVRNVAAIVRAVQVIDNAEPSVLRSYLRWRCVSSSAKYLSKAFVMEDFNFNEKILMGTAEIKPRWKRAMAFTESALGEALGQTYCSKYFDETCKDKALCIVEKVRQALEDRLKEVDWMKSESTRMAALNKMSRFKVKIGYPDKWIDFSTLDIKEADPFLTMAYKARSFHHKRDVQEMNAPTNRLKWFMTPQTVNAYYHPSFNEIVFPAAILQPPFFDPNEDDAINFGAMGAVVGHEMTHGFDDKGRKFDSDGNMIDWWTAEDGQEYERRVEVMVEQANDYSVYDQKVQGKLTCGENIADLGGLRLALRAVKSSPNFSDTLIDGFTQTQRFFFGWARCWRQNITKERCLQLITIDPHGPNEMRCNGPLSNMAEFAEAFDIPEDSAMYRPIENRVNIW